MLPAVCGVPARQQTSSPTARAGGGTYKELLGGGAVGEGVLLRRRLHGGRHVDEVGLAGLLVELGLEGADEGIARHGPAGGAAAV
jgi:hypothetical protein